MTDKTPQAAARSLCGRHWPIGTERLVFRAEVEAVIARVIAEVRRTDARLCNRIALDGGDTHTAHVAVLCRDAILAQNRKRR